MKKKILFNLGIGAIVMAYVLNLSYATDNYGIKTNSLSFSVLAQSGSSSGGGSSSVPPPKVKQCRPNIPCQGTWNATASSEGCVTLWNGVKLCIFAANIEVSIDFFGIKENCTGGSDWEDCDACAAECVPVPGD